VNILGKLGFSGRDFDHPAWTILLRRNATLINWNQLLNKKVLITGASGFIGLHLCRKLLEKGNEVHALCRSEPSVFERRFNWHKVDLTDLGSTRKVFGEIRPDMVFHLCSHAEGERELSLVLPTFQGELTATVNVLLSLAETGCSRVIMAGSLEESRPGEIPSSPYAAAKAASRAYASMFHQLYKLPVVMTRIFMAYGPGQSQKKLIPHSIISMIEGRPLKIASPARKVDWIYVEDLVLGLLTAAVTPGLEGKSIDLGSGEMIEIQDVVRRIRQIVNPRAYVEFGAISERAAEQVCRADAATTYALTGWHPATSLEAGLEKTVDFFLCSHRWRLATSLVAGLEKTADFFAGVP
jgi:nucleoside-diphosphate-sugar epimerase